MRILLLRHAKSSWDTPGSRDHDRPLSPRGQRAAHAMGAHLAGTDLHVDRIVSSSALRAHSTAQRFRDAFDRYVPLSTRRDLFHASAAKIFEIAVEEMNKEGRRILLVGHNPGVHDLALMLCRTGDPVEISRLHAKFPTGALAEIELPDPPKSDARSRRRSAPALPIPSGRLLRFLRPKDLPVAQDLRL